MEERLCYSWFVMGNQECLRADCMSRDEKSWVIPNKEFNVFRHSTLFWRLHASHRGGMDWLPLLNSLQQHCSGYVIHTVYGGNVISFLGFLSWFMDCYHPMKLCWFEDHVYDICVFRFDWVMIWKGNVQFLMQITPIRSKVLINSLKNPQWSLPSP